jgi:hypothetical protein
MVNIEYETQNRLSISYKYNKRGEVKDVEYKFDIIDNNEDVENAMKALTIARKNIELITDINFYHGNSDKDFICVIDVFSFSISKSEITKLSYPYPRS